MSWQSSPERRVVYSDSTADRRPAWGWAVWPGRPHGPAAHGDMPQRAVPAPSALGGASAQGARSVARTARGLRAQFRAGIGSTTRLGDAARRPRLRDVAVRGRPRRAPTAPANLGITMLLCV